MDLTIGESTFEHIEITGPPNVAASVAVDPTDLESVDSTFGRVTAVRPFAGIWPSPPERLGTSAPTWR